MVGAEVALTNLLDQVRAASADQLGLFARTEAVTVEACKPRDLPFVQQMTQILVTGSGLEVSFKTHFMVRDALQLTGGKLKVAAPSLTSAQGIDFMKEFCNLVAGKTKAMLERVEMSVAQSLPIAIQGYNEIFYPKADTSFAHAAWRLRGDQASFCCSLALTLRTPELADALTKVVYQAENAANIGDVELF